MGHHNDLNLDTIDLSDWAIINSPGGRYLGRISGALNPSNPKDGKAGDLTVEKWDKGSLKRMQGNVIQAVSDNDVLELYPAFDFLAPLRPVQGPQGQMALTRDPIIMPIDFVNFDVPVYVKAASIYFCADMKESDQNQYKAFVQNAMKQMTHQRAAAVGLTLAGEVNTPGLIQRG